MNKASYQNFQIDVQQCIKNLMDNHSNPNYILKEYVQGFFSPPEHFKRAIGIDVSGKYNLGGLSKTDIQLFCYGSSKEEQKKLFYDLLGLNPDLEIFKDLDHYDILMGIASDFNMDDIWWFAGEGRYGSETAEMPFYRELAAKLHKFHGYGDVRSMIQWVISPKTSDFIIHKINEIMGLENEKV